jgi:hypothetical protein
VTWPVVEYLAAQLGIADASYVKRYTARAKTAYEHAWEIRGAYGFRAFEDPGAAAEFRLFLEGRAWTHAEGPYLLFGQAVAWLRRNRVPLPGVSVLARLVASVRDSAADRMHRALADAAAADAALPSRLQGLLLVPDGQRVSEPGAVAGRAAADIRQSDDRCAGPDLRGASAGRSGGTGGCCAGEPAGGTSPVWPGGQGPGVAGPGRAPEDGHAASHRPPPGSRSCGAGGWSPRPTGCGSSCRCRP